MLKNTSARLDLQKEDLDAFQNSIEIWQKTTCIRQFEQYSKDFEEYVQSMITDEFKELHRGPSSKEPKSARRSSHLTDNYLADPNREPNEKSEVELENELSELVQEVASLEFKVLFKNLQKDLASQFDTLLRDKKQLDLQKALPDMHKLI